MTVVRDVLFVLALLAITIATLVTYQDGDATMLISLGLTAAFVAGFACGFAYAWARIKEHLLRRDE